MSRSVMQAELEQEMAAAEERLYTGPWMEEPNGPGIYHFIGIRWTTMNALVKTNDLCQLERVQVGKGEMMQVLFFGRSKKFRLAEFVGKWRKLMGFQGKRSK